MTKKYEKYPEYKNSGIEWLGKIPKNWQVGKVKEVFNLLKEKSFNNSESEILSLTLNGIKTRDVSNNEGQIAASYEGYRKISSKYEGIISPAYSTLRKKNNGTNSQFYNYFFQKHYFEGIFHPFGNGVSVDHRWTLKDDTLMNFPLISIPEKEQTKIANYLDEKTETIDQIIEKKQKLIEFLQEKRTAAINHEITDKSKGKWKIEKIKHMVNSIESGI
ncbi:MAG: restriction endonuclease subunit S, partial [Candidatus Taylorbacteria bacterium]|nr:restriction endonuclease subunit S [Candidatus Taylorbacteria bacterium]